MTKSVTDRESFKQYSESLRKKIQSAMIVRKFQDHLKGKIKLSGTQIQAGKTLLDKTMSSLSNSDITQHTDEPTSYKEMVNSLRALLGDDLADMMIARLEGKEPTDVKVEYAKMPHAAAWAEPEETKH